MSARLFSPLPGQFQQHGQQERRLLALQTGSSGRHHPDFRPAQDSEDACSLDAWSDGLRPESLQMTSPLEQLTRSLSFNNRTPGHGARPGLSERMDSNSSSAGGYSDTSRGGGKGKQRAAQQDEGGLAADEKENIREDSDLERDDSGDYPRRRPPPLEPSLSSTNSFLDINKDVESPPSSGGLPPPRSSSRLASAHPGARIQETRYEPVRFSKASEMTDADDSDAQSQLIDAFRHSYATHLTTGRDSSYSWMMSEPESPGFTMDFAKAAGEISEVNGEVMHEGLGSKPGVGADSEVEGQGLSAEDWEGKEHRARARASSWDSQAANEMNLGRTPSTKSINGVRSALARRKENMPPLDPAERQSAMSMFDPFQYSQYESAPNSADEHSRVEELEVPSIESMPAGGQHQHPSSGMSAVHPSSTLQPFSHSDVDADNRPTSIYAYPLTPPMSQGEQFASSSAYGETGSNSETPRGQGYTGSSHKAKISATNYTRPYQRSYLKSQSSSQVNENANAAEHSLAYDDGGYANAQHASSIYPASIAQSPYPEASAYQVSGLPYSSSSTDPLAYADNAARPAINRNPNQLASPMAFSDPTFSGPAQRLQPAQNVPFTDSFLPTNPPATNNGYGNELRPPRPQFAPRSSSSGSTIPGSYLMQASQSSMSSSSGSKAKRPPVSRSPSSSIASAIAKHRAQREAAGLTTDGEYYVDPKTGKHYFVAASGKSGRGGRSEGKENQPPLSASSGASQHSGEKKKGKERRKLHKKESGWEVSRVDPVDVGSFAVQRSASESPNNTMSKPMDRHQRSGSQSAWSAASGSDDGQGKRWKPWGTSSRSREGTPHSSPVSRRNADKTRAGENDPQQQEWIWQTSQQQQQQQQLQQSPGSALYGGMVAGSPSPSTSHIPTFQTTPAADDVAGRYHGVDSSGERSGYLSASPMQKQGSKSGPRPGLHDRNGSVYSNYSYYGEMLTDHALASPGGSPSPATTRADTSFSSAQSHTRSAGRSPSPGGSDTQAEQAFGQLSDMHSPGGPSGTLHKAKRSNSLQLLAVNPQSNLTVPKGKVPGPGGKGTQQLDLSKLDPDDPLVCLHLGIDAHEQGDLENSVMLFEKSARQGCGLGMLMYGLALRHGWGCEPQPEKGFGYLQQAAESVVSNLDKVVTGQVQLSDQEMEEQAAKSELVLSIYELGQCFLRGWGVGKDKRTALAYFALAADLGDPDAQSELGFCYSTGRGCKKDLKKAARYYRLAAKQGYTSFGMQWIYKSKYDD